MTANHPKIIKHGPNTKIQLLPSEVVCVVENIHMNVDINPQSMELVGVEIVDLCSQIIEKKIKLENLECYRDSETWEVSYDPEYDIGYFGLKPVEKVSYTTQQSKGSLLLDKDLNLVGIEVNEKH